MNNLPPWAQTRIVPGKSIEYLVHTFTPIHICLTRVTHLCVCLLSVVCEHSLVMETYLPLNLQFLDECLANGRSSADFFFFFLTEDVFSLIAFCGPLPLFITNTTNTYWLLFFGDESKLFHWLQYEGDGLSLMVMGLTLNTDSNKQWVKCDNFSANRLFYFFI